uniref:Dehydrogenase/reductase SDR family member 1 n=1 Tax=Plectus sambesii TaxID=2011161 RepID=A0A914WHI0_9BILA
MAAVKPLSGKVAIVTGASRGIGRGIALQLGQEGATVYVTGRSPKESDSNEAAQNNLPTLQSAANEITSRGGKGIAVYCDHRNADDIARLFEQVASEQNGQLDILVNNAFSAVNDITKANGKKFWELEPSFWDSVNDVGLRNHYICSVHAARLMVPKRSGLIVTISSPGGLRYLMNVAYGVGKCAKDRMAADMAVELKEHAVTSISLWPGTVKTELVMHNIKEGMFEDYHLEGLDGDDIKNIIEDGESIEFSGMCVAALAKDPKVIKFTGRTLFVGDLGDKYGLVDIDGRKVPSTRSVKALLGLLQYKKTAALVPGFIKIPGWIMSASQSKF